MQELINIIAIIL